MTATFKPATATLQVETPTVRVTRWDFPPQTETGDHRHDFDYVVVPVTDGVLTITTSEGEVLPSEITVGDSYSRSAGVEHNVVNLSDVTVSFVEIELLEHRG